MVLRSGQADARPRLAPGEPLGQLDDTVKYWQSWLGQSKYKGRWREIVERSAITLKLMTYAPTGALVAAPTAALPEQVGGERNWDYRYTWIRDSSFSVYALLGLGFTQEAFAFARWLADRVSEQAGRKASGPLRIMYRMDGSSDLAEETLDHLDGWRGSRPVRIGNGAADQRQLDIYGEALDAIYLGVTNGAGMGHRGWQQAAGRHQLALRALGSARGGHLGDARRPERLHLRALPGLAGPGPGHPPGHQHREAEPDRPVGRRARPHLRPDHDPRLERRPASLRPVLRRRRARRLPAPHAFGRLRHPLRSDVAVDATGHRRGTRLGQPRLPV